MFPNTVVLGLPIPSEDEFYGIGRGVDRLAKHIQWVYIPAVKDVTTERSEAKTTALGKLLSRTVRLKLRFDQSIRQLQETTETEYGRILKTNQGSLEELQRMLNEKLEVWAHPSASVRLTWQGDSRKSVQIEQPTAGTTFSEGGFEGDLARLGHGFQRSYLLALLQVLAGVGTEKEVPRLILGCEEPELYQHPPQARHLASVLEELSSNEAQVLLSTHDPVFVTGRGFESVRVIRFDPRTKESKCNQISFEEVADRLAVVIGERPLKSVGVAAKLHQLLQPGVNEMFFARNVVLVEGLEDVAILTSWMVVTGRWTEFRRRGIHIVPVGGKSQLLQPLAILQSLGISVFTMFDADGHDGAHQKEHKQDNERLLQVLGGDAAEPFPRETLWGARFVVWATRIGDVIRSEIPEEKLATYESKANAKYGHAGGLQKNSLQIGAELQLALEDGVRPASLERLCETVLKTAEV